MNITIKQTIGIIVTGVVLVMAIGYFQGLSLVDASAPSGLKAVAATTTAQAVTTTQSLVFATSTCSARVVSTVSSPIMIGFSDIQGLVPTGVQGHLQAASTTVVYDSGTFGCDAMRIMSFVNSTITVTETR